LPNPAAILSKHTEPETNPMTSIHVPHPHPDANMIVHSSARESFDMALDMLRAAQEWANDLESIRADIDDRPSGNDGFSRTLEGVFNERRDRVAAMELSLYRELAYRFVGRKTDGIWRDGQGSFYWSGEGMSGGLIFHADYAPGGRDRLPVGTWSSHT
jgi:hypothetical protein